MWFEKLVGFKEESPEQVRNNLFICENKLISKINGKEYQYGQLEIPTLNELKMNAPHREIYKDKISISEIVGDVKDLHKMKQNHGAIFQVASQFNLLEMVGPHISPERGVDIYERDYTQGPSCAIACGAGTIYRNYFAKINDQIGQTSELQINCLDEIEKDIFKSGAKLWDMKNGYLLISKDNLITVDNFLNSISQLEIEDLQKKLRVGIQKDTEVTISASKQVVSQVYCSALPISYSSLPKNLWENFARLILDATYEATFYAALENYEETENEKLYLTLVGGGVFGNKLTWILDAIEKSILKFKNTPLDVKIVSYNTSNMEIQDFIKNLKNKNYR